MTPRQKALVRELKKTEHEKCIGMLADGVKRCVLGIACEVYIVNKARDDVKFKSNGKFSWYGQEHKHLPYVVKEYFGFRSVSGSFSKPLEYNRTEYVSLQHLNDESPAKLSGIATFIKDNADAVFETKTDKPLKSLKSHPGRTKKKSS